MKSLVIILDPAHGKNVPGKSSPDGMHKEYFWSRYVCSKLQKMLKNNGYDVFITVSDDNEPGLKERVKRANKFPGTKKILISIHNNAAGDGLTWRTASGVEIYTTTGKTKSDIVATEIMDCIQKNFSYLKIRSDFIDGDIDKESNFTVLTGKYYAVLLEWLFMDNREDLKIIQNTSETEKLCLSICQAIDKLNDII